MTIQEALQAVTHRFPAPLPAIGTTLLGQECYALLIWNADLRQTTCLRLAVSKALGVGIIIFGSILKLPQMATIWRHKSAHGVSLAMYALEVVAYDISLAYAYRKRLPFSTYGENASLTVQNMVITLLILWYGEGQAGRLTKLAEEHSHGTSKRRNVGLAACAMLLGSIFLFYACPPPFLAILQALSIPISCISKLPQIAELHRNGETGHLSSIVVFAQLAGTLARVFTTVTETGDWLIGLGFGLASILNAVIAAQYLYYWDGSRATLASSNRRRASTLPLTRAPKTVNGSPRHPSDRQASHSRDMSQSLISISIDSALMRHDRHQGAGMAQGGRIVTEKGHHVD